MFGPGVPKLFLLTLIGLVLTVEVHVSLVLGHVHELLVCNRRFEFCVAAEEDSLVTLHGCYVLLFGSFRSVDRFHRVDALVVLAEEIRLFVRSYVEDGDGFIGWVGVFRSCIYHLVFDLVVFEYSAESAKGAFDLFLCQTNVRLVKDSDVVLSVFSEHLFVIDLIITFVRKIKVGRN